MMLPRVYSAFRIKSASGLVNLNHVRICSSRCHVTMQATNVNMIKSFEEMPKMPSLPLIGSSWLFLPIIGKYKATELHLANAEKYKKYGKIFREVSFGGHTFVHLFDPNDIETVFRNEGKTPYRLAMPALVAYLKMQKITERNIGLLLLQGQDWLDLRTKVQGHMLNLRAVRSYLPDMESVTHDMIQRLSEIRDPVTGEVPDFLNEIYKWALESISLIVLERRLGCLTSELPVGSEPDRMIRAANTVFAEIMPLSLGIPLWRLVPTPSWRRLTNALDTFHEISLKYISEALKRLKTTGGQRQLTLLESLLISANQDKKDALAMAIDALLGGIDTTSHSFAFTLYHLARNQDCQNEAYAEILSAGASKDRPITPEILNKIPYLRACFKESLRLHPVVSGTTRKLSKEIVLSGYKIPARMLLILHTGIIGRFDDYFVDADKFKPKRWMDGESREQFSRFLSLPFGFGNRMCIGRRLAEQEIWLLLIRILLNFKVEYHYEDIDIESRFVNAPNRPLRFQFIDRT